MNEMHPITVKSFKYLKKYGDKPLLTKKSQIKREQAIKDLRHSPYACYYYCCYIKKERNKFLEQYILKSDFLISYMSFFGIKHLKGLESIILQDDKIAYLYALLIKKKRVKYIEKRMIRSEFALLYFESFFKCRWKEYEKFIITKGLKNIHNYIKSIFKIASSRLH